MKITHVGKRSKWLLYHGTSTARLKSIAADKCIYPPPSGIPVVSLTTNPLVATYFACNAAWGDRHDRPPRGDSDGAVLVLDGNELDARGHLLTRLSDPVWGEGECDWEEEIACWSSIRLLDTILVEIIAVSPKLYRDYTKLGSDSFREKLFSSRSARRSRLKDGGQPKRA